MRLTVLNENTSSSKFAAEHGLSYYIEYDNINLLFDTGHSNVFLENAKKLKIDIDNVNTVVLSHGHWDHGNGLRYLKNKKLICHPEVFKKRYSKINNIYIGLALTSRIIHSNFDVCISSKPYYITDKIIFLGEIPRLNDFEATNTAYIDEKGNEDYIPDDSALTIILKDELVIVSGCAHSGICNIIEYAKKITGIDKIKAVIGGFHLKYNDSQTQRTIEYLKEQNIEQILPSHCTELPALAAFYNEFKNRQVKTGMVFNFD